MTETVMGRAVPRVDGPLKVTGRAPYAADISVPELTHGYVLSSGIAKGWIRSIDIGKALDIKGVLKIFTHENRPRTAWFDRSYRDQDSPDGSPFRPLASERICFSGQPVALVVAETLEIARYAASLIEVEYGVEPPTTRLETQRDKAFDPGKAKSGYEPPPGSRGNPEEAYAAAPIRIEAHYTTPMQHHNPMEMHASTVIWEDDEKLTVYDKTQSVLNSQSYVCNVFNLKKDKVRVLSPFVGGAFGSGLRPQYQLFMAVMAALELKRSGIAPVRCRHSGWPRTRRAGCSLSRMRPSPRRHSLRIMPSRSSPGRDRAISVTIYDWITNSPAWIPTHHWTCGHPGQPAASMRWKRRLMKWLLLRVSILWNFAGKITRIMIICMTNPIPPRSCWPALKRARRCLVGTRVP
jgi:hypothetical protein